MYQQPSHKHHSTDSLRRLSSNNPFRQQPALPQHAKYEAPRNSNRSNLSVSSGPSNYEDWVERNKQLVDVSSDEDDLRIQEVNMNLTYKDPASSGEFSKPKFPPPPGPVRADSDSSVNYGPRKMSSNNPFAAALNEPDSYVHRREPPPVPRSSNHRSRSGSGTPPTRPPKPDSFAPPSYEEAAGKEAARRDYPREKQPSSSSSSRQHTSSRPHRSHHSDPNRPHRSQSDSRPHRSSREKSSGESRPHRSSHKSSSRNKSPSKKKPEAVKAKNLDTIDKLDVTAFFGGGFHHDGPFDACTPHRNKNVKAAPVMAFPPDGPNNSISGLGGNIDKNEQLNLAFGNYDDGGKHDVIGRRTSIKRTNASSPNKSDDGAVIKTNRVHNDVSTSLFTPKQNPSVVNFDSHLKAEPVHGETTAGLGSSTFIEGAPAPKAALNNDEFLHTSNGGLGRKKSIVQRLRKNSNSENNSRRNSNDHRNSNESNEFPDTGRRGSLNNVESNENYGANGSGGGTASSLLRRVKSLKVRR